MFYFAGDVGSAGYGNARSRQHHDLFGKIIEVCGSFRIFLALQVHTLAPRSCNSQSVRLGVIIHDGLAMGLVRISAG